MVLLHDVDKIFDFTDGDGGAVLGIVALDRRFVGRTAINRDLLGDTVTPNRLFQKAQCRFLVPLFSEEEINSLARLIYGAIEVIPVAFDLDIRLVHAPTHPHRALTPVKRRFQLGTVFDDPALDGGVVDRHPALLHQFFDMPIAPGVGHPPPRSQVNTLRADMRSFEADRHRHRPTLFTLDNRTRSYL